MWEIVWMDRRGQYHRVNVSSDKERRRACTTIQRVRGTIIRLTLLKP